MGEIKSTLDLVMEKTRHLTLSQEEKKAQKGIEVNKRLQGLLQRYQDNSLKKENLKKELDHLKLEYDLDVNKMLAKLLLDSLKIDRNNTVFLDLLGEVFGINPSGFEAIFQNFKDAVKYSTKKRVEQLKMDLSKKRLISGSAIVPNLERDREWLSILGHIKDEFDEIMNKEKIALSKKLSMD
jgi:hypothetical protein